MNLDGRRLDTSVFVDGEFGFCFECGKALLVTRDLHDVHLAEDDSGMVHFVWYHRSCNTVGEVELGMDSFRASKSFLHCLREPTAERVFSDAELEVQRFRSDLGEVMTVKDLGWVTEYGHE